MEYTELPLRAKAYRVFRPVCLFFAPIFFIGLLSSPASAVKEVYIDKLLASAREQRLSEDRYWDTLVHYKPAGPGKKSLIDDPKFFLAADGKVNPQAELEATLRGVLEAEGLGDDHPRCRFIARYDWLRDRLNIDEARLPRVACAKFEESFSNLNLKSAALIFPAAHGNGPASMFGHTLIRIDSVFQSDLLSYAVNYAALAEDTNGFIYTFKGIFGFYKGYYSILPYYEKVKEYNNIEHRDIWEYRLNLSEAEVRKMVLHIWEIRDTYSDYFFFDENCSYNLLFLLEAARPSLRLTDVFWKRARFWVVPSDTVRSVRESGLVEKVTYRPSLATRIHAIAGRMNNDSRNMMLDVVGNKITPGQVAESSLAADDKIQILDLSAELLQYRYSRREIEKEEYLKRFLTTLNVRSALGKRSVDLPGIVAPHQPDRGHYIGKFGMGAGYRTDSYFGELSWRAAYHDLLDPDEGYVEGAQINFFDIRGRYYPSEGQLKLHSFRLLDIFSLAPRDAFFKPVSWKVTTGFDRKRFPDGRDHLIYRINPGGGVAYQSELLGITYALIESDVNIGGVFKNDFSFGLGPSLGLLININDYWKINLFAQSMYYELGDKHRVRRGALKQVFKLSTNNTVELSLSREKTFEQYQSEAKIGWNVFY